jgi:hypothetical protein
VRGDVLLETVEAGGFFDAGLAPGAPEIEDDDFAAKVGEVRGFAVESEREVAGFAAGDGGFALAVAGQREGQDHGGGDRDCGPICEFSGDSHQMLY